MAKKSENEKQIIFTTKLVDESTKKINDGILIKRYENPWLKGEVGLRRSGVVFKMTADEQQEYVRCALDINYFVEKYCRVKREDGSVGPILLRDYQKDILDLFKNRFTILMAARQSGKTISSSIFILHFLLFNNDKNTMIIANKNDTVVEIVDKIKSIYTLLPFFLKSGIKVWNQKSITFENGCRIKTSARTKTPAVGFTIDLLYLDEFAHIPSNIIEPFYTAAYPTVSAVQNSKIIITSTPNGMNLFHKILTDAERPDGDPLKNNYKPMRVYWYQVPGRFVTYIRLNDHKLWEHGLKGEDILDICKERWGDKTKVEMNWNYDLQKDVISIFNNDVCSDEDVKTLTLLDNKERYIPIQMLAEVTTWKEDVIKDIGGEDAFNQEYGLRFINASKSLLNESIIDDLLKSKKNYVYEEILEFNKLRFSYEDLKWVDDEEIFIPIKRRDYKVVISVDLAEGLGQDYSVINIFRLAPKSKSVIDNHKNRWSSQVDFFKLEQIGIYRSNIISVKQMAELLYLLSFEYFNPENVRVVLELNNYGNTLLAEMPHVFEGNNDYGSSIFVKYKHRVDSNEEKVGLKVGENKNLLVKDYQDLMYSKSFGITNEDTIREITTFVKHTTTAGNTRYAADVGHDDCVMTIVNATSIFQKNEFKEMVDEFAQRDIDKELLNYINQCMNSDDFVQGVDYSQLLRVKNHIRNTNRYKNSSNRTNWFGEG
jgi:hypothetical protein